MKSRRERKYPRAGLAKVIPLDRRILTIRGHKVILDADLAEVYGVTTKRLNEQAKRNRDRFPPDFSFQLTQAETSEVVQFATTSSGLNSRRFCPAPSPNTAQ